jgi:hypothetical protein
LNDTHDKVNGGTGVGCAEFTDKVVELARGRADAEEEGNFDEEDYEGAGTVCPLLVCVSCTKGGRSTYRQMALKTMRSGLKLKIFAMPSAKHKIMLSIPALCP